MQRVWDSDGGELLRLPECEGRRGGLPKAEGAIHVVRRPRWRRVEMAALWPHMPCTPAPGGVAAEHR
ncbi:hypothetical protein GCM10009576_074970 [Streptomyces rhizosphaericus]|uniref:Transposase n=2 Tax=Streptomyces rhizosphaericus TaxID=114699 RepID=A0ABP3ZUI9_9ACTN